MDRGRSWTGASACGAGRAGAFQIWLSGFVGTIEFVLVPGSFDEFNEETQTGGEELNSLSAVGDCWMSVGGGDASHSTHSFGGESQVGYKVSYVVQRVLATAKSFGYG